jgi:Sec-independent protein translocase protein TatA
LVACKESEEGETQVWKMSPFVVVVVVLLLLAPSMLPDGGSATHKPVRTCTS